MAKVVKQDRIVNLCYYRENQGRLENIKLGARSFDLRLTSSSASRLSLPFVSPCSGNVNDIYTETLLYKANSNMQEYIYI